MSVSTGDMTGMQAAPRSKAVRNRPHVRGPCVNWAHQPVQRLGLGPWPENCLSPNNAEEA